MVMVAEMVMMEVWLSWLLGLFLPPRTKFAIRIQSL